ncbi:DNA-binding transcriptional activator [Dysgonomonas sp. Marseille-P4677]|uniref:Kelch repeat-containing protein n=1 Tax=Dysgonomonas sp. Marseille-P4677 TaxID=2364790 RepID=UPI0019145FB0|nr:DNA-binding transcriptional activator [Dysgonomonas sp. Marseille-P4677]MBK5723080.1 DNA-binding transcriptional activator [Dysgonomonas sp. Marseille-P4677]
MKRFYCILLILLFTQFSFSQGLKFKGNEQPIDKRTSYNVFKDKSYAFSSYFNIEFRFSLNPPTHIGYIIRIKNEKSNTIYNLFYDGQGENLIFKFNEEGKSSLITAEMNKDELLKRDWFKMAISFDLQNDSIKLTINNKVFSVGQTGLPNKYYPIIVFGKSDHIIDVPSFAIKDLIVGNDKKYSFALKENEGEVVHDQNGNSIGFVSEPEWLINEAYHWSFKALFKSKTIAGANYNPEREEVYYFNSDSIFRYNVRSGESTKQAFIGKCPIKLVLGTNFVDTKNSKLYAYEVHYNNPYDGPSMASLDLNTYMWTPETSVRLPIQLHHHTSYLDTSENKYTIFGGFGNMRYSENFYSFDLDSKEWNISNFDGDTIFPRYFSSMGYLKATNSLYVFGGMGNESGEQVVGRKYFYDLHKVDLTTKRITKLWEIPWNNDNVVPVRGMVILNDSCFYTLCYPEHFSDSFLRLYRFSLKDGSYEILGDSIPIHSDRITTNANLYYDDKLKSLFAVVQEFDDDIISDLKIYSLIFPPITAEQLADYAKTGNSNVRPWLVLLSCICIAVIIYILYKKLKTSHTIEQIISETSQKQDKKPGRQARPNSIYLFGEFLVRDKHNRDITYMFSTKLRQAFCIILQYSTEEGISSQRLSHLLWPDRPEDKVKNSRGVTINHLRKVLGELDGIALIYDKGFFKLVYTADCYCDYLRCFEIIQFRSIESDKEELIDILARGKFLKSADMPLFDLFKETVEHKLEPVLLVEMKNSFEQENYQATIDLTEAIFDIDPMNDEAIIYQVKALLKLKLNDEAKRRYQIFITEYKRMIGNNYPYTFSELSIR